MFKRKSLISKEEIDMIITCTEIQMDCTIKINGQLDKIEKKLKKNGFIVKQIDDMVFILSDKKTIKELMNVDKYIELKERLKDLNKPLPFFNLTK